ncbi:NAD dependent epimerase/dehydratase [Coprinopsis marcescibilis]|uniref:NAD dependent epimerase/dehydratase n=1 Tax=Coprinopsis marcescibilis TaxID=230819 RepID=A0A5C3L3K4_COPMA|nr:NAD dependent epimerase/dehydratase [Coprinopsis marcescibilis]
MDIGLKGVHVLVTGASGGIGLATVRAFAEQGAHVTAHYNTNNKTLGPVQADYENSVQAIQADLTNEDQVKALFQKAYSGTGQGSTTFGPIQVLIVNHAIYNDVSSPIADMSLDQWNATLTSNLTSTFLVVREYLARLREALESKAEDAAVVLIGSTAGKYGEAGHTDYAASKSAMMYGLTMSLKNEIVKIAPKGRVNCVAPGWVKTPMAEKSLKDPDVVYRALASTPLKKVATPEDVARQVLVLSSRYLSGHVTGQVVMVEGGMEGRLLNSRADVGLPEK